MSQVHEVQHSKNVSKRINLSKVDVNELTQLQEHMNNMLNDIEKDIKQLLENQQAKRNWLEQAVAKRKQDLEILNEKLKNLARKDYLTGILNRGSFFETAQHLHVLCQRQKSPVSFMLMDLDNFKMVNDNYGYFIGDKVLKHFTQTIQDYLRKFDVLGRVGREEFALLLADTGIDDAYQLADKLRKAISHSTFEVDGKTISYIMSIGIESS